MTPLTILCASTRQWNPGDEWIARGIRRLFRTLYPDRPVNWILYDRSPDCFLEAWQSGARRAPLAGNSLQPGAALPKLDLIVIAGTPEWHGPHLEPLARIRDTSPAPVFYLGIDFPTGDLGCTPEDLKMLSGAFIVTRGGIGSRALRELGFETQMLPCPALFAASCEYPARQLHKLAIVLQSDRVANQSISPELKARMLKMVAALPSRFTLKIVCNYLDEFLEYSAALPYPVCYSYDSGEYFDFLGDCDVVISTRLHSALIANSLLKPAIVTNPGARIASALETCPYIFLREPEQVPEVLDRFEVDATVRNLFNWKRSQEAQYLDLLRSALKAHGLD